MEAHSFGIIVKVNDLDGCRLFYREQLGFKPGMLPATEYNSDHICSLPLFPDMTFDDVMDVVEAIKAVLAGK